MKIAVVGAGITGLSAAWLLSKQHTVHLFESSDRLGGHAHTVTVEDQGQSVSMDTGFLVYNELTYPNLCGFFNELQVETVASDMTLSIQVKEKNLEWCGTNLNTVFGQRRNLVRPSFYVMLKEILRFHKEAQNNLVFSRRHGWTLQDLLQERKYSLAFAHDYIVPIGAAIWSTPEGQMLNFPAETFLQFFINHRLLQVNDRPVWRTVKNGSIQYVQKAATAISHVHLNSPVTSVERVNGRLILKTSNETHEFDRVVMATHAPQTRSIVKTEHSKVQEVLGAFQTEPNRAYLHQDQSVMPNKKLCWAAWNVVGSTDFANQRKVCLSYYLNKLQPLNSEKDYFVTLNPIQNPQSLKPLKEIEYSHPVFNHEAIRQQKNLSGIQGLDGIYYAGAWSRYGFHEDGILSAVKVSALLGVIPPWGAHK